MTARTHDLAALTALTIAAIIVPLPELNLSTLLLALLANQIGGVTPDIDQPTAPLWRNLPIGHLLGKLVGGGLGGHRFLTHSILGLALFGFLAHMLLLFLTPLLGHANTGYIWWSFMIGMFSHLLMDSLTKEGVPWLLPIPYKFGLPPLRRLRVTTGKSTEALIVFPVLLLLLIGLFATHQLFFIDLLQSVHR